MPSLRTSRLLQAQSFDAISQFLREGMADEATREMRDSLSALSQQIEALVQARRKRVDVAALIPLGRALADSARVHQRLMNGLGTPWQSLYEFAAYQRDLRRLRDALDAWLLVLEQHSRRERRVFQQFEQRAWRTLGGALLLIDMYEQSSTWPQQVLPVRSPSWWQRLRAWLG